MYPVGKGFHSAARAFNRQVIVRCTFNDSVAVYGDYLKGLTIRSDIKSGNKLSLGCTCMKQLNLDMYIPETLKTTNLDNAKIFVEIAFLGVTSALSAVDTQLYVNEILGYLYQSTDNNTVSFSLSGGELVANISNNDVTVRLSDGAVVAAPAESVDIASSTFWLPMGVYYVRNFEKRSRTGSTSIVAYDGMKLIEELGDTYAGMSTRVLTAPNEIYLIAQRIGVNAVIPLGLPNRNDNLVRTGFIQNQLYYSKNVLKMLGYYAGYMGCNACFDRVGNLTVKPYQAADYHIDRRQQYLGGYKPRADMPYAVDSVVCKTPETESDLTYSSVNFEYGWIDESTGTITPGAPPSTTAGKSFYSDEFYLRPDVTYTLSRTHGEGDISLEFYGRDVSGAVYIGSDEDGAVFSGAYPINAGSKSGEFTVKPSSQVQNFTSLQTRIYTGVNCRYKQITVNGADTYDTDDSFTIRRHFGTDGVLGTRGTSPLEIECPYLYKQDLLDTIQTYYKGLSFMPCEIKYRGNPALDPGDIITAEDQNGIVRNVLITSQTIKIGGGMHAVIESTAGVNL